MYEIEADELESVSDGPRFWTRDTAKPQMLIAQFWHIPWPNRETFRICPWGEQILEGLLGNDLLGFHIRYHCQNFLESVAATVEARVDHEDSAITRADHVTRVRPFPISLDIDALSEQAASEETPWPRRPQNRSAS